MQMQSIDTNSDSKVSKLSAIDRALELAKQRAALAAASRAGLEEATPKVKTEETFAKSQKDRANKELTELQRAAAKAKMDAERSERRAAAEAKRAAAKEARATKQTSHGPVHMKKVDKAASRLPALSAEAQAKLTELRAELSNVEMTALALHMQHHVRVAATSAAHGRKFTNGQRVRIVGGDPRFIGQVGIIDQARNIRCFVNVEGAKKPVYVFTSDIEPCGEEG